MSIETSIISAIGSLGFPIVVAWYLLTRVNESVKANTKALGKLEEAISELCKNLYSSKDKNLPI